MRRLRIIRQERGWTLNAFARAVGMSPGHLYMIEIGLVGITPRWREAICQHLGWPMERWQELLEEVEDPYPGGET